MCFQPCIWMRRKYAVGSVWRSDGSPASEILTLERMTLLGRKAQTDGLAVLQPWVEKRVNDKGEKQASATRRQADRETSICWVQQQLL